MGNRRKEELSGTRRPVQNRGESLEKRGKHLGISGTAVKIELPMKGKNQPRKRGSFEEGKLWGTMVTVVNRRNRGVHLVTFSSIASSD